LAFPFWTPPWLCRSGFNPCCLGLAVLAGNKKSPACSCRWFQSLLSWISRFGAFRHRLNQTRLSCFNPCCLGLAVLATPSRSPQCYGYCFNPCCLGLAVLAKDRRG